MLQQQCADEPYDGGVRDIADKPGDLLNLMMPFWLFEIDHAASSRMAEPRLGNWDVFLGVLNTEAAQGVSCGILREILYGPPDAGRLYDRMPGMIWSQVLQPLCWLGLLAETISDERQHFVDRVYTTTDLWSEAFRFPFDGQVGLVTLH